MVGDITYIVRGRLGLATVIDCATRKIVGWAMDDNYKTPLISRAIQMAARNLDLPEGAVFHSDRGSNYTSAEFAGVLKELGITQSVGRTGICYDMRLSVSVNGTLRTSSSTGRLTRPAKPRWMILRGGSSSAIIRLVSTPRSGTGLRKRFWTST